MERYVTPETGYKLTQISLKALVAYGLIAEYGGYASLDDFPADFEEYLDFDVLRELIEAGLIERSGDPYEYFVGEATTRTRPPEWWEDTYRAYGIEAR